jgi:alginate O-acetyltransferase complex protein AlgI
MRPIKIFLLLFIFLVCFTGLHYVIPGIPYLPEIEVFFPFELLKNEFNKTIPPADSVKTELLLKDEPGDSISNVIVPDSVSSITRGITGGSLAGFIDSLISSKEQVRIMYYGDSQLEGDRITSYLRRSLQNQYGGTGPGLMLPVMPVMYTKSVYIRSSTNWKRYNWLSFKSGEINTRKLGPFMTFCRYLPPSQVSETQVKATIRIQPSKFADRATATYENLRLFYGNLADTVSIKIYSDNEIIRTDTLERGTGPFEYSSLLYGAPEVLLEFTGKGSPDIYGLSLESRQGVIVDNIPQRGSAGLEFTMVDEANLDSIYMMLDPDLFILQYGLNIVRNVRSDYSYYENGLCRQIDLLKNLCPDARILVLSLTDMAFSENDSIKSFPNIEAIRDAQQRAAMRTNADFWDAYKEMGGKNSIIKWVDNVPPLAQLDYTHLTYSGADSLSHLLIGYLLKSQVKSNDNQPVNKIVDSAAPSVNEKNYPGSSKKLSRIMLLIDKGIFYSDSGRPFIFTSPDFWIFFLLVLAVYSLVYRKLIVRNMFLFLISLFFYYKTGGLYLSLLILVIIVDYTVGLLISKSEKKHLRRLFLLISLISNLGILAYFKYTGFFIDTFNSLFDTELRVTDVFSQFVNNNFGTSFDITTIVLPIGISFFTFQSISYTIDVYRKKVDPVRNILDFGFYVSFFPQLVAGPIVRASEFIPQIYLKYNLSKREFSHALFLILKGLIKKIIISDFIASNFIDRVFDTPSLYSGFENLMAVYGYGLQIYCDFSGYTDIAIGLGLLLGFRLPVNFNSPYKASSISDFWKRWHISLSRWLKDYLYIPLGGNRRGKIRTFMNLFITMVLGGLWHGASLRFVIWGALHGFGLMVNKMFENIIPDKFITGRFFRAVSVFLTFQFVSFCWIFFRADGMDQIVLILRQIGENFSPGSYLEILPAYGKVFGLILTGYIIHLLPEKLKESYRGIFIRFPMIVKLAVVLIIAILLYQAAGSKIEPFIYFRF